MQYGFVIDHDRCIGCHACTVACKAENEVPVGDFRTWVKYTEQGKFPSVKRSFAVLRCNHCTDAPCVTICPVNALEKRKDGIVDLDRDACIGCRACMQACPYDALYLNEDSGAAEKCHFCAHRVERGLEPACVIVCPENAIIAGDIHDPNSRVSQIRGDNGLVTRRPEQGTGPNVYYKGVDPVALNPGAAARPEMYLWSDRPRDKPESWPISLPVLPDARTVLDAGHKVEWGWTVALYLVTKGIGAGAAILAPFVAAFGLEGFAAAYLPELLAFVFTALTCAILVEDLARPMTFYKMLTRPNWKSWLVKGGVVLSVFMGLVAITAGLRFFEMDAAADGLRWINAMVGLAAAGYTAFLFAQCKGRDLWESRLLLPHLLAQAALVGAACLIPFAAWAWRPLSTEHLAPIVILIAAALAHLALSIVEQRRGHETDNAKQAAAFLGVVRLGPFKAFRDGLLIGVGATIILAILLPGLAFVPALGGLFLYEHAFVRAGQLPPLS
ncbi:MAG: 4Fe-4S dicluster domain-containing protein [Phycisphaerales bacterium]